MKRPRFENEAEIPKPLKKRLKKKEINPDSTKESYCQEVKILIPPVILTLKEEPPFVDVMGTDDTESSEGFLPDLI